MWGCWCKRVLYRSVVRWPNIHAIAEEQDGISYNYKNDTMILDEMVNARYIRINGTSRSTEYGYSIKDIAVYGKSIDTKPDGTTPVHQH